jgi:hypothetical protein
MSTDSDRQTEGEKIMAEIGAIPAILAFPPEIFAQLDELCELRGFTHHRLVVEAVKSRLDSWKQISDEVLTPIAPGEIEVWPEDPLDLLARVVVLHAMRLLIQRYEDPAGFEEDKELAPAEWSFCSAKDLDEDEPADWWK